MDKLKMLADEISACRKSGVKSGKPYPSQLKTRVCSAAKIYGNNKTAKAINIDSSLISKWSSSISSKQQKIKKRDVITFSELPTTPLICSNELNLSMKLVSPSGFSLEFNNTTNTNIIAVINTFMGGK